MDFEEFQRENFYWLQDFALFKVIKDNDKGKQWYEWEESFKNRDRQALQDFQQDNIEKIVFQMWMQWVLFKQFKAARDYAAKNSIFLEGDLPVLVSRDSADVWAHPEFFKLGFAAGAPPDSAGAATFATAALPPGRSAPCLPTCHSMRSISTCG